MTPRGGSAEDVSALLAELQQLPDVEERPSQFADIPAFWIDGREFLHLHGPYVEIRLTRKRIARLDDERVAQRARTSDWVIVPAGERELVVRLAREALEANRR
jgi:hypothetical protein